MSIWTRAFWKDTAERIIVTAAEVAIAILSVDGLSLASIDLVAGASAVAIACGLVFLKAIVAAKGKADTISPASFASNS